MALGENMQADLDKEAELLLADLREKMGNIEREVHEVFKPKMIDLKEVKPKWYENKWLWFGLGVVCTAGSVKLAGEIID